MVYFDWNLCRVSGRKDCPRWRNGIDREPDRGNYRRGIGRLAFRCYGDMDDGGYRESDHRNGRSDRVVGDRVVVQ